MSTNFPTSLDSLTNPTSGDSLNNPSHSGQHANANDAIEALEAKVGADSSAVTTSHDYKITKLEVVVNNASASAPASLDLHEDTDNGTNKITITAPASVVTSDKVLTLPDETGIVLSNVSTLAGINISPLFAPRGFLINGKIVPTDASGITVALKTLAGTDPSATDPVYVRIGDTVRSITSALSVVLADGTNWFNAGGAELATKEIDYFVYAVYDSNSSAVALTFARIPSANLVSDFSATTTNEKYCAGYAGFTTTDEVEVIGRFAATLSAGAGYTWSVPTYTAVNLIQRPIFETRWLAWTPVLSVSGGNAPTYTSAFINRYKIANNSIYLSSVWSNITGGTAGTTTNAILSTIPLAINSSMFVANRTVIGNGQIFESTGTAGQISLLASSASQMFFSNGGVSMVGESQNTDIRYIIFEGFYEI